MRTMNGPKPPPKPTREKPDRTGPLKKRAKRTNQDIALSLEEILFEFSERKAKMATFLNEAVEGRGTLNRGPETVLQGIEGALHIAAGLFLVLDSPELALLHLEPGMNTWLAVHGISQDKLDKLPPAEKDSYIASKVGLSIADAAHFLGKKENTHKKLLQNANKKVYPRITPNG